MKESEVRLNCVVWSARYKCFGQILKQRLHMVQVLFVNSPRVWLHCEEIYFKPEDEEDGYKYK